MRTGVVILCRYASSRLPGKILKKIDDKTILAHIAGKIRNAALVDQVVVATSTESSDDIIQDHTEQLGLPCFRGDLENVAGRFLACSEQHGFDYAIRINGDNLFTDPLIIDQMAGILKDEPFDFISNVPGRSFPYGMSVEILKTSFFKSIIPQFDRPDYHEHVTLYLYEHEELGKRHYFYNSICPELKGINLAIDDARDFQSAVSIFDRLSGLNGQFGLRELCSIKDYIRNEYMER